MVEGGHLKKETEAVMCVAQEQALRVNSLKNILTVKCIVNVQVVQRIE